MESEYHEAANAESMLEAGGQGDQDRLGRSELAVFQYQSLKREADSDKKLYEELVRKIKEAGINAGFQNSSIRIADEARPGLKPVFPRTWLNVLLAFLSAAFIGVGAAVLSDVLDNTIRDPDQVTRLMKTDVIGSLPAVKDWRRRLSPIQSINALKETRRRAQPRELPTATVMDTAAFMERAAGGRASFRRFPRPARRIRRFPTTKRPSARCAIRSC